MGKSNCLLFGRKYYNCLAYSTRTRTVEFGEGSAIKAVAAANVAIVATAAAAHNATGRSGWPYKPTIKFLIIIIVNKGHI